MLNHLHHHLDLLLHHWKPVVAGLVMIASWLGQIALDLAGMAKGWEDLTLKGVLIIAVLYLAREGRKREAKHENAIKAKDDQIIALDAANEARDARSAQALTRVADALDGLTSETKIQTEYWKGINQDLVERGLGPRRRGDTSRNNTPHTP
ncbi:hypothetical protein [Verrucomicrobium spinosum]|nr:hypothetical protein [Verrucomicrobium spinosum]